MTLGIGLYAPCLILVSLLGMNPIAAFPIMMGSCAVLMPVAALRFIRDRKYDLRAALGLTLGGIPAVLLAAYVVRSLPLTWLRWLVVIIVLYAAALMLLSARAKSAAADITPATRGKALPILRIGRTGARMHATQVAARTKIRLESVVRIHRSARMLAGAYHET